MEVFAKKLKLIPPEKKISELNREEGMELFDKMQGPFMKLLGRDSMQVVYTTIYNNITAEIEKLIQHTSIATAAETSPSVVNSS